MTGPRPAGSRPSRPGIAHIGVGGFHRAHQAMYVDALGADGDEWGIVGIGLLPADRRMRDALTGQDCLYTLTVRHPDGTVDDRVVGSIIDYLFAPDDEDGVRDRLADPAIRIVSLTITEGGYNDPAAAVFRHIVDALRRRRADGVPPFTVVSCDNIEGNGRLAREITVRAARSVDQGLAEWIEREVSFPNSMVDRITPAATDADRDALRERGIRDAWPVVCEPFAQWVLEDDFPSGRPPLERVGVTLVDDVAPYELMKLRLLNAGHQALGHLGTLAGYEFVHDVSRDPLFATFLRGYLDREATPTLRPVPGVDLAAYKAQLLERFGNPYIRDTLTRLRTDASDRVPKFLLPVIRHQIAAGGEFHRAALVVAAWARCVAGVDDQGRPIEAPDRHPMPADATRFLADREVFGDLTDNPVFARVFLDAYDSLRRFGVRETLRLWEDR